MANPRIIGVMLDPARLTFQHQWYERWLPDFADWGYNTLILNLADDTGCALELRRRPELTSRHAFSQDEMSRLIRCASQYGIEIIPLISSLGHTGYIFWRKKYRHLGDGLKEQSRKVICPSHPESRQVLTDVLEEVMEIFPTQWLHVGLDETGPLPKQTCSRCRKHFAGAEGWEVFVQHVEWLHQLLSSHGKRLVMWGDFPLHYQQAADHLPKDIVIFDWHYEKEVKAESVRFFLKHGFEVVGVPALIGWPDTIVLPHDENLANLAAFARVAQEVNGPHLLGQVNSVWHHAYNLFATTTYGIAYGADQFRNPGGSHNFGARFCRRYFGVRQGASQVARLLMDLHLHAPHYRKSRPLMCMSKAEALRLTSTDVAYGLKIAGHAQHIGQGLREHRFQVTRNRRVYDAYILAADIVQDIGLRGQLLAQVSQSLAEARSLTRKGQQADARKLRREIAQALTRAARRARTLANRLLKNWDWGFYPDDPCRQVSLYRADEEDVDLIDIDRYCYMGQNIFYDFQRSTTFLERLARQTEQLALRGLRDQ